MQPQRRRARNRKRASPGLQRAIPPSSSMLNNSAGYLDSNDALAAKGRISTLGQTAHSSGAWKFVVIDPTKKSDLSAKQDLHAFLTTRHHHQRRDKLESPLSPDQHLDADLVVAESSSRKAISQTSSPEKSKFKRTVPVYEFESTHNHSSSDQIVLHETATSALPLAHGLEDPTNPLNSYAHHLQIGASTIWAYYLWQEREHGRLFHAQYERYRGWGPKHLHPLILADPAVLATTVLFIGCLLRQRAGDVIMSPSILQLRSTAYSLVQGAIDLSNRPSNATILAVVKLALFEAMFGQHHAYTIHMQGLVHMVQLRDGLSGLGEDGYLAHLLMWFDANLSARMNTPRYLLDVALGGDILTEATADETSFGLGL